MPVQRNTKQRQMITACVKKMPDAHFTADQLAAAAREADPSIGRATVYRFLNQMHEKGLVRKYTMPDGASACWQYVGEHSECHGHYHLKCNICGEVIHLENDVLDKLSDTLRRSMGFIVDKGETVIYGKCAKCANSKGE